MLVYLDGRVLPREEARVSVDDRGFVFGDGVYEVTRVVRGHPFEAARHRRRLLRGLAELRIPLDAEAVADLDRIAAALLHDNGLAGADATIYTQITRGAAPRTHYFPPAATRPTVFVSVAPFTPKTALCERGVGALTQPDLRWGRCDVKTVQLLPNVLAQQAAAEARVYEAILVRDGIVTEGSHTNVFAVVDGALRTHPTGCILPGITREVVLELARELSIPTREVFVTGTTTDVMPVVTLDERPVADGAPGPITRRLYAALLARMGETRAAQVA